MLLRALSLIATVVLCFLSVGLARAADATLETIQTPRGARQAFLLIKADKPIATVILFAGGHGALGLNGPSTMKWGQGNFLVRSRDAFARRNLNVAVIDAPSDQTQGMSALFRMGSAHVADIEALAANLKSRAKVPVWLVGTSMGTFSAAAGAIGARSVDGLVLTSTITRAKPAWKIADSHRDGVASMPLGRIVVPTLALSHRKDGCDITPAGDIGKLKQALAKARKVEIALLDGGDPPQSDPCEAKSQHGFLGVEDQAIDVIARFIKSNPK